MDDDLDQDGFLLADDCDDTNSEINPETEEIYYDGIDNDCNPETIDDDQDHDGFVLDEDCNDMNAEINPDAEEIANNGIDEDCDGSDLVVGIKEIEDISIHFYPNPVQNSLHFIQLGTTISEYQVRMYSHTGKIVYETVFNTETKKVQLNHMDTGFYFLNFLDLNSGKQFTRKILVTRL